MAKRKSTQLDTATRPSRRVRTRVPADRQDPDTDIRDEWPGARLTFPHRPTSPTVH